MLQILLVGVLILVVVGLLVGYRLNSYHVSGWECGIVYTFLVAIFVMAVGSYAIINHATSSTENALLDYNVAKSIVQGEEEETKGPIRKLLGL